MNLDRNVSSFGGQSGGSNIFDFDFDKIGRSIYNNLVLIISICLISFATVFYLFNRMPDQYESVANMITVSGQNRMPGYENSIISSSILPEGALVEAVKGPIVINDIITRIKKSGLDEDTAENIVKKLEEDKRRGRMGIVSVTSRLDIYGNGLYTVHARAGSPEISATLANNAAQAILAWDRSRAAAGIVRAIDSMSLQLREIDRQLSEKGLSSIDKVTLISSRAALQKDMAQAGIQKLGASGSLELITPAVPPLERIAPKPLRNGIYAALISAFILIIFISARVISDRTISDEDDLLDFGVPVIGILPKIRRRDVAFQGIIKASRMAGFYESIGFLKVNFLTKVKQNSTVMITSTVPGEGKSSVTAAFADALAKNGLKVLIIDADVRRGTQRYVWGSKGSDTWIQLLGKDGIRSVSELTGNGDNIQVLEVENGVHLLPAVASEANRVMDVDGEIFENLLTACRNVYDYIIIDTPPIMALSDSLTIGKFVDNIFLVVEQGQAGVRMIRSSVSRLDGVGLTIDGFILNKVRDSRQSGYEISRSYYAEK